MSYCPYCGAKNDDTSMFCVICGKELPKTEGPGFDPNDTTRNDPNAGARGSQPKYSEHRDEGIMMILSIIFPGLGVFVVGKSLEGMILMILNIVCFALGFFFLLPFLGCLVVWIAGLILTHQYVKEYNDTLDRTGNPPW